MKINLIQKTFLLTIFFIWVLFSAFRVEAAIMSLVPSKSSVGLNEQFYIDLFLDPEGVSINGIEGNITFPSEYLSFIRSEEGKSMINFWIQSPELINNIVKFTGIIPNGFSGVIDPFNQNYKLPGLISRFVFESIKAGEILITTPPFTISLNDGLGTTQHIPAVTTKINIQNKSNKVVYEGSKESTPEIEAYITKDPNLFDNKYTLIFKAVDRGSGIKEVLIKEGSRGWKKINSPYVLEDQTRHSIIVLQASNYYGSTIVTTIEPIKFKFSLIDYLIFVIILIILFVIIKKKYVNKKNKK